MDMKKEIIKKIGMVLLGIIIFFAITVGYFVYQIEFKKTTIAEFVNSENHYIIKFQEIGEPFLFGPSKVIVVLEDESGKDIDEIKDYISNDGSNLQKGNISVVWTDTGVEITLHGDEQEDKLHELQYQK